MEKFGLSLRREHEDHVNRVLASYEDGHLQLVGETQAIDFKEEAGRRNRDGSLEVGSPTNPVAAVKLADEVACFANTPGGGVIIFGVEDGTGKVIGSEVDVDWLRQRIHNAVSVAPEIVERTLGAHRVLVLHVAAANEPVENSRGQLCWRVGDSCRPVDRAAWWEHQNSLREFDPFAQPSPHRLPDIQPEAMRIARSLLPSAGALSSETVLRQLGALRSDDRLTEAGALMFCPVGRTVLTLTVLDVPGGRILKQVAPEADRSLLEQLWFIEGAVESWNQESTVEKGMVHSRYPHLPRVAVREALLNGVIHRDWARPSTPTEACWIHADSTLVVRSPGGFPQGINDGNVLSNRNARYPALADLFRALTLVEKQGLGVDRMYQSMITVGHQPPALTEVGGPFVECVLRGGAPVVPVLDMVAAISPAERRLDVNVAVIIHELLHRPFITVDSLARALQCAPEQARNALRTALQTSIDSTTMIRPYKSVWRWGEDAWRRALKLAGDSMLPDPFMEHATTDPHALAKVVDEWLRVERKVSTGDLCELTGVSRGTVQRILSDLTESGSLMRVGRGRSTGYVAAG